MGELGETRRALDNRGVGVTRGSLSILNITASRVVICSRPLLLAALKSTHRTGTCKFGAVFFPTRLNKRGWALNIR